MQFDYYSIRLLTTDDADALFDLIDRNRPRLESFFAGTVSKTQTAEATRTFVADNMEKIQNKTYFPYLVIDEEQQKIAGFMDLKNIDWNIPKAEMGCYIDAAYAGKGITKKAFGMFCNFCFDEYQFQKLFLRTHEQNTAARKLAEKCGFKQEGIIRRDYKTTAGELVDLIYYGRLNDKL